MGNQPHFTSLFVFYLQLDVVLREKTCHSNVSGLSCSFATLTVPLLGLKNMYARERSTVDIASGVPVCLPTNLKFFFFLPASRNL